IREISVGYATVFASRRTYMGELGWELYVPVEFAATVFDALHAEGAELGLRDMGYYAIEGLRIEKAYRAWGRELTPDDTPWQAGLGWGVKRGGRGGGGWGGEARQPGRLPGAPGFDRCKAKALSASPAAGGPRGPRAAAV